LIGAISFVSIPSFFVAGRCMIVGLNRQDFNVISYGTMLFIFDLSVWHDVLSRVNFFGNDQYLVSMSRVLLVISCAFILAAYSSRGSKRLRNSNAILEKELENRTHELITQFKISEELLKRQVVVEEERRIRQELDKDLHDGVLSYISVINLDILKQSV